MIPAQYILLLPLWGNKHPWQSWNKFFKDNLCQEVGNNLAEEKVDKSNCMEIGISPFSVPAFDVTPAELIAAIICERGVIRPVNRETIAAMLA